MVSWTPALPPATAAAAAKAKPGDTHMHGLLPLPPPTQPACPQPFPGLDPAAAPRALPPIAAVSMAHEYSEAAARAGGGGSATPPLIRERWAALLRAGVPPAALLEVHSPTTALHPLSAFEAAPWLVSPGVSAAWWAALCARGVVSLRAEDVDASVAAAVRAGARGGAAEGGGADAERLQQCGSLADRVLAEGSGATLPLAFVLGLAAKDAGGARAALAAVLAESVVVLRADAGGKEPRAAAAAAAPPLRPRVVLASEARAYTSVGWRVALAPAWPAPPLAPGLLSPSTPQEAQQQQLSQPAYAERADARVAADAVRVAIRSLGALIGEAEGVHEATGRWAENCAAWMAGVWAAVSRRGPPPAAAAAAAAAATPARRGWH